MNKTLLAVLLICVFLAGSVWPQAEQKPYTYKFNEGIGDCTFTGVSKDSVWSATIKTFMLNKYQKLSMDKPSGIISASRLPSFSTNYRITLVFEDREGDIGILASVEYPSGSGTTKGYRGHAEKTEKKLFDQIAAEVYGVPAYAKSVKD